MAKKMTGAEAKVLKEAYQEVRCYRRPEEKKHVKTAIGAARAEQSRSKSH